MRSIAFTAKKDDPKFFMQQRDAIKRMQLKASIEATDLLTRRAHTHMQAKIRSVGLGKLSNAVGYTSYKKKRQTSGNPYGVIYARGGDETLAGGALEAYSRGATITAKNGIYLAVPTKAAPKLVSAGGKRRRLTPALWRQAGLDKKIGPLIYKQIRPDLAILAVRRVSLSPKTGQAKAMGKRKPRTRIVPERDVTVFILIKRTRRAKRFDKDEIVNFYHNRMPDYLARLLSDYQRANR